MAGFIHVRVVEQVETSVNPFLDTALYFLRYDVVQLAAAVGPNHGIGDIGGDGTVGHGNGGSADAGAAGQGIVGSHDHIAFPLSQAGNLIIGGLGGVLLRIAVAADGTGVNGAGAGAGATGAAGAAATGAGAAGAADAAPPTSSTSTAYVVPLTVILYFFIVFISFR